MDKVKIFASIVDDVTKKQVEGLASSAAYKDSTIRIMPDCHSGKGCTIGSVIHYTDKVVPNTVGVDIGCGMLVVNLGQIDIDLQKLDVVINSFIPSGFNVHESPVKSFNLNLHASVSHREYIQNSIGTLGGGNHFIEVDTDNNNNKYLVIHSGSRNLGVQVCNYWQERAIAKLTDIFMARHALIEQYTKEGRQQEISEALKLIKRPEINNELAYLEGDDLAMYIQDMEVCQQYASVNRITMAEIIASKMGWGSCNTSFTTIHNYIDIPNKIIRKGAISANKDEVVIIPMNMRDGSLICKGKGNEDWLCSAPHGAGRIMSRKQALDKLNLEDFKTSMQGIYTTSVSSGTLDEAPMVYKSADVIMQDIKDTVDIIQVIKPIYNFKAKGEQWALIAAQQ